jgi:hypothetical protein
MKNQQHTTLPMTGGVKRGFRIYVAVVLTVTLIMAVCMTAYATGGAVPPGSDPVTVVGNLSDFIFGLIRAIGMIMIGFGIVQVGLSLKSHDPSQRANGFLTLCGGVVIAFAKEILTLITGG